MWVMNEKNKVSICLWLDTGTLSLLISGNPQTALRQVSNNSPPEKENATTLIKWINSECKWV